MAIAWLTQSAKRLRRRRLCPLPQRRRSLSSCVPGRTRYPNRSARGHPMRAALRLALMSLLVATRSTTAQETPTEKTAAADVIRRINELEPPPAPPPVAPSRAAARARRQGERALELVHPADDV